MLALGWRASLTLPLFEHNRLVGFLLLASTRAGALDPKAMATLEPHRELLRISNHFSDSDSASLHGTLRQQLKIAELQNQETAIPMEHVSLYSRLIALQVEMQRPRLADFRVKIYRFATFHDPG